MDLWLQINKKKKTSKQISSVSLSDYLGTYLGFVIFLVSEYTLHKIGSNSTVSAEFSLSRVKLKVVFIFA